MYGPGSRISDRGPHFSGMPFIKTFASSESTLQNLEIVDVKIANVENWNYKVINAFSTAKNQ